MQLLSSPTHQIDAIAAFGACFEISRCVEAADELAKRINDKLVFRRARCRFCDEHREGSGPGQVRSAAVEIERNIQASEDRSFRFGTHDF